MVIAISESSLDDLLHTALCMILDRGGRIRPTRGEALDLNGVILELTNPQARLSRSEARGRLFSAVGELSWYLAKSDKLDFISRYIPNYVLSADDGIVHGAYGRRLFDFDGFDQVRYVIERLRRTPYSRQAVIQLFDHTDVSERHAHVPCTCTLQFFVRDDRLQLIAYMRSNDVHLGLPHDIFCFTMLQELVACSLDVPMGSYLHIAGSLHLYARDIDHAKAFLREGWQSTLPMPAMPLGDPWNSVDMLVAAATKLHSGADPLALDMPGSEYWNDLIRILAIFALIKTGRRADAAALASDMVSDAYQLFITEKLA